MPELASWTRDDREPDLLIHTGKIVLRLADAQDVSSLLEVDPEREACLAIDGVSRRWAWSLYTVAHAHYG